MKSCFANKGIDIFCYMETIVLKRLLCSKKRGIMNKNTKSVLHRTTAEFYMDGIEYCPKEVYDNPVTPEDIW